MDGSDLDAMLATTCKLAVATIRGAQHCGIALVEERRVRTAGASDGVPATVDQIQYDTGEGPCLDAIRKHHVFETTDLGADERWPAFTLRAVRETGVRSMLSFRLYADDNTMGSLNLYSPEVDAFDDDDRHVGLIFAAHAAVALSHAQVIGHLERALLTRDVISTAKGILMAASGVSDGEAFDLLRRASQRANVKLRVIAQLIIDREPMPRLE
jgi:GAF domain-containing protein